MLMKGQIHPLRGDYLANESGEWGSCLPRGKGGAVSWLATRAGTRIVEKG